MANQRETAPPKSLPTWAAAITPQQCDAIGRAIRFHCREYDPHCEHITTGEARFIWAILDRAISDLHSIRSPWRRRHALDAYRFLTTADIEPYCVLLGLRPEWVQRKINQWLTHLSSNAEAA